MAHGQLEDWSGLKERGCWGGGLRFRMDPLFVNPTLEGFGFLGISTPHSVYGPAGSAMVCPWLLVGQRSFPMFAVVPRATTAAKFSCQI